MNKKISGLLIALFIFAGTVAPAHAAPLTESQIQSILNLLNSFGANSSVINNVNSSLRGIPSTNTTSATDSCVKLSFNLSSGWTDATTNGEVTTLQKFLARDSSIYPQGLITGYFGPATEAAVQRWQSRNSIVSSGSPDSTGYGYVGPSTRARIGSITCGDLAVVIKPEPPTPAPTPVAALAPIITSTSCKGACNNFEMPIGGGNQSFIYGNHFSSDSSVFLSGIQMQGVHVVSDTILSLTIPSWIKPGIYNLNITSKNISSNIVRVNVINTSEVPMGITPIPTITSIAPRISSITYSSTYSSPDFNGTSEKFEVNGSNFSSTDKLHYVDTKINIGTGKYNEGFLTYMFTYSPNKIAFAGNLTTANSVSIYRVKVIDAQGRSSNEVLVNTIPPSSAPTITRTSAKTANSFEMDAGGEASIFGSNLSGNSLSTTKVVIGEVQAPVTYASDNLVNIKVPSSLLAGQSYRMYISNEKGVSNTVNIKILSNLTNTTPAPVAINATCVKNFAGVDNKGYVKYENGVASVRTVGYGGDTGWTQSTAKSCYLGRCHEAMTTATLLKSSTLPVNYGVDAYFWLSDGRGSGTCTAWLPPVTTVTPSVVAGFTSSYDFAVPGKMISTYTYSIQNYNNGLVLDIEPTINCRDTIPLNRDCSQYLFNLSGKAMESYLNVRGNPYVSGGALYRFTGSNGQLNLNGFINPSYVPPSGYSSPIPDSVNFKFILRDINQGKEIWSETKTVPFGMR